MSVSLPLRALAYISQTTGRLSWAQLPDNYAELSDADKKIANFIFNYINQVKWYEISGQLSNDIAYRAMNLPRVFKELFLHTSEEYQEAAIALRECWIEIRSNWVELGFSGDCSHSFSDKEVERHRNQFQEYQEWHQVHKLVKDALCTNVGGWVSPEFEFDEIARRYREIFEAYVENDSSTKT
jgi:hypothetical protein